MLDINNAGALPRGRRRAYAGFLKSLIGSAFILLVLGLSPSVGLAASKGGATLTDSPGSGLVGDVLTVSGGGFPRGMAVSLTWNGSSVGMPNLTTVRVNGSFVASVTIPNQAPGPYTLQATAGNTTASTTAQILAFTTPANTSTATPTSTSTATPSPTSTAAPTRTPSPSATPNPTPTGALQPAFPRVASIYSKNDENSDAGKRRIARYGLYVSDITWWGLLCGGTANCNTASPATTTTGQFLKMLNPNQIDVLYQHSVFVEKNGWSAPADGRGYIIGATPYYIDQRWLLTYAGSTLGSSIDGFTTTIPVTELSTFTLGDNVIVGGVGNQSNPEMLKVAAKSASSGGGTLSVIRAQFDENGKFPAIPHLAGDFVRTVVHAFGLQDFLAMNMGANCPATAINPAFGPQTWNQFQASFWQAKIANDAQYSNLDGFFLDNVVGVPNQIMDNPSQIDYLNTNVATDVISGNSYFASGMSDNAVQYRLKLPNQILLANTGGNSATNGTNLNGGMVEGVDQNWSDSFIGDVSAFYNGWQSAGRAPETFIMNGSTATSVASAVEVSYQAVRFELALTLMNNGYFDYDEFLLNNSGAGLNSGGHQTSWWYDEYDDGGQRVGYLGQPSGTVSQPVAGVYRRDFQNGIVLANTSASNQSVSLGGTYRRIASSGTCPDGTLTCTMPQTAQVTGNDGSTVTSVTLAPKDGLILLASSAP